LQCSGLWLIVDIVHLSKAVFFDPQSGRSPLG
jgi:hypothetical protein